MKSDDYQAGSVRQLAAAARTAARVLGTADAEVKNKAPAWIAGARIAPAARLQAGGSGVRACRNRR